MSTGWWQLTDHTRQTAEHILTRKQLDVLKLSLNGLGTTRIALMLDISEPTARAHLRRAHQKLAIALRHQEAA